MPILAIFPDGIALFSRFYECFSDCAADLRKRGEAKHAAGLQLLFPPDVALARLRRRTHR